MASATLTMLQRIHISAALTGTECIVKKEDMKSEVALRAGAGAGSSWRGKRVAAVTKVHCIHL